MTWQSTRKFRLLVRVFRTDGTIIPVSIDAFLEPENSKAVQESVYAERTL